MSQKNETLPLILALLITAGILGGSFWWLKTKSGFNLGEVTKTIATSPGNSPSSAENYISFEPPTKVPGGTTIRINGSTSMVNINMALKNGFELQFPGTKVEINAQGSDLGIQALLKGDLDVAASSRPLMPGEANQGLTAIPVTQDALAVVVGVENPFRQGLTAQQVIDIFQGKTTDWSVLGGKTGTIRVINRPPESGTRQIFQELVLKGEDFGGTPNIETLNRDATTPMLRALGTDGIGYATFSQVANQMTVRTVAIDGLTPEASSYPYQRLLFYVYQEPANPAVKAFLGYFTSPQGQKIVVDALNK